MPDIPDGAITKSLGLELRTFDYTGKIKAPEKGLPRKHPRAKEKQYV
jgi:hypothetical protein